MSSHHLKQGQSLLEEWPDRSDQMHSLLEDWPQDEVEPFRPKRKVTMSEYSEVRLFINGSRELKKSYSSNEVDMFRTQASLDASSIQNLLSRFNQPTGKAIHSAFGLGLIKHENVVGLEHLVSQSRRQNFVQARKTHSAIVLRAQKILREKGTESDEVASIMLAKVAARSSSSSTKKAVLRASMPSIDDKANPNAGVPNRRMRNKKDSSSAASFGKNYTHFRVPSVDSVQLAHIHAAKAKSRGRATKAAIAA